MSIYDLLAIAIVGAGGFVLGVVTTIKVDDTHERLIASEILWENSERGIK